VTFFAVFFFGRRQSLDEFSKVFVSVWAYMFMYVCIIVCISVHMPVYFLVPCQILECQNYLTTRIL